MLLILSHCCSKFPHSSDRNKIPVSLVVCFQKSLHLPYFSVNCLVLVFLKPSEFSVDVVLEEFYLRIWN